MPPAEVAPTILKPLAEPIEHAAKAVLDKVEHAAHAVAQKLHISDPPLPSPPKNIHEEFIRSNAAFAAAFEDGHLALPPARHALVLACMDARLHVEKVLGIKNGACHCVRNAGGRASDDALRSIAISQRLLGTKEVHIVHHTGCGMLTFTNAQIAAKIKEDLGTDVGDRDFLPFHDLQQSVLDDIRTVQESPLVAPGTEVHGYIYEVETGKLRVVQ